MKRMFVNLMFQFIYLFISVIAALINDQYICSLRKKVLIHRGVNLQKYILESNAPFFLIYIFLFPCLPGVQLVMPMPSWCAAGNVYVFLVYGWLCPCLPSVRLVMSMSSYCTAGYVHVFLVHSW